MKFLWFVLIVAVLYLLLNPSGFVKPLPQPTPSPNPDGGTGVVKTIQQDSIDVPPLDIPPTSVGLATEENVSSLGMAVSALQTDISAMKATQPIDNTANITERLDKIDGGLVKIMERQEVMITKTLEELKGLKTNAEPVVVPEVKPVEAVKSSTNRMRIIRTYPSCYNGSCFQ